MTTKDLSWRVYDDSGQLVALHLHSLDAVTTLCSYKGGAIRHGRKTVWETQDYCHIDIEERCKIADRMRAAVYGRTLAEVSANVLAGVPL